MIELLYYDAHLVVCIKPAGVVSQEADGVCMPKMLKEQLGGEIYPVHRLDKAVGGVMVYARTREAAAKLTKAVQDHSLKKTYLAVLCGEPEVSAGVLEDLLFHDKAKNKTYVVGKLRKGVKPAKLEYTTLYAAEERSLVLVRLHTGRTHQIRVQFASRKLPLVGDRRYGGKTGAELGLWSCGLSFDHPVSGRAMDFRRRPPETSLWEPFSFDVLKD